MNVNLVLSRAVLVSLFAAPFFLYKPLHDKTPLHFRVAEVPLSYFEKEHEAEEEEMEQQRDEYTEDRLRHEYKMLRNPVTGSIPTNYRQIELEAVRNIPAKRGFYDPRITGITGGTTQNIYEPVGPNNVGGRSRALGIDRRNPNIMLTGSTTGGIFRTVDGGANWAYVLNENDIHSVNTIVQDPTQPDTWYCGTGEMYYPPSASDISHGTYGWGIFKSIDNGITWNKLPATEDNNQNVFNGQFDLVHRMAVHPATGFVYAAIHNRIVRSKDGGQTWELLLGGVVANTVFGGQTEIYITPTGSKIFAAFSGENAARDVAGVWESSNGNPGTWTRIAGGAAGQSDSVAGWAGFGNWGRVVLTTNNAGTKLFAFYKNSEDAAGGSPKPEADLFRCDVSSGNPATYTWTNLKSYVPDEPGFDYPGIDPFTTQFNGYNMSITVKPDNDNILFIGGASMDRVNLSETQASRKFRRIGGYGSGFFPQSENFYYPNHHPDIHWIVFPPNSNDLLFTADDGGIHKTSNSVMSDTVRWTELNSDLQTLQYQSVNIHPDTDADFIIGGAQDNGTQVNYNTLTNLNHQHIAGGDGASTAISAFRKNGNTWKQSLFLSIVEGAIYRVNLTWTFDPGNNDLNQTGFDDEEITPSGLNGQGQWLTLFTLDPDSTEQLYYNSKNKLYRTKHASTVTSTSWTELTGVGSTIPAENEFTAMALSRQSNSGKYLFFATDAGKVYRLNHADSATSATKPIAITPNTMSAGSYVAAISVNPRNPDTVLLVVSNYDATGNTVNNIFWTGNATAASPAWRVIDGALGPVSSQSCAIVVKSFGVEYYVGTSVGLYSTTAINGNSTDWFNEGNGMLKKAIIRSIVNRPQDNTMVIGTHGNGAFLSRLGDAANPGGGPSNPDTVTNKTFIKTVYPTLTYRDVQYQIGNLFTIKKISVQVYNMAGQLLYQEERGYANGSVDLSYFARGVYILAIYSGDQKYKHIQKILKQ